MTARSRTAAAPGLIARKPDSQRIAKARPWIFAFVGGAQVMTRVCDDGRLVVLVRDLSPAQVEAVGSDRVTVWSTQHRQLVMAAELEWPTDWPQPRGVA